MSHGHHPDEIKDLEVKVVVVGDTGVGKTSLVQRYVRRLFTAHKQATVGAAFMKRVVQLEDWQLHLQIWDTAGQERFRSMAPMYYRGADAAILVYDVTDLGSLRKVQGWVEELRAYANDDLVLCLAGNKSDLLPADFLETLGGSGSGEGDSGQDGADETGANGETVAEPQQQQQQQQQQPRQQPGSPGNAAARRNFVPPAEATAYARSIGAREFRTSAKTGSDVDGLFEWIAQRLLQLQRQRMQHQRDHHNMGGGAGGNRDQDIVLMPHGGGSGRGGKCC